MTESKLSAASFYGAMRPSRGLSAARYFTAVGLITVVGLIFYIVNRPLMQYQLASTLGIINSQAAADHTFYQQRVQPIFKQYCTSCHNHKKAKGSLRLHTYIHARYSGKSREAVLPYDSVQSALLSRLTLADNDKRLMPPLGWDRPNADEIKVLELWIEKGASNQLSAEEFPEAPPRVTKVTFPKFDPKVVAKSRAALAETVARLQQQFPHSLTYLARNSNQLRFSTVSLAKPFTDQDLQQFKAVASQLSSLYIRDGQITDNAADTLLRMTQLQDAHLHGVELSQNRLLTFIDQQQQMQRLSLHSHLITTKVRDLSKTKNITLREL